MAPRFGWKNVRGGWKREASVTPHLYSYASCPQSAVLAAPFSSDRHFDSR